MFILDKIKILLTLNKTVENIEKEYKMESQSGTPGYKTTEFWLKVFAVDVPAVAAALTGVIPAKYALGITAASTAIYGFIRVIAKGLADWHDIQSQKIDSSVPVAPPASTAVSVDVVNAAPSK